MGGGGRAGIFFVVCLFVCVYFVFNVFLGKGEFNIFAKGDKEQVEKSGLSL